jgi:hypothetical protein
VGVAGGAVVTVGAAEGTHVASRTRYIPNTTAYISESAFQNAQLLFPQPTDRSVPAVPAMEGKGVELLTTVVHHSLSGREQERPIRAPHIYIRFTTLPARVMSPFRQCTKAFWVKYMSHWRASLSTTRRLVLPSLLVTPRQRAECLPPPKDGVRIASPYAAVK